MVKEMESKLDNFKQLQQDSLVLLMDGVDDPLYLQVRESDVNEIKEKIEWINNDFYNGEFIWFRTINERDIAINLKYLQAVNYQWDPIEDKFIYDRESDYGIEIKFKNRNKLLTLRTDDYLDLYYFYSSIRFGTSSGEWEGFRDENGEYWNFNVSDIVYIDSPSKYLEEGKNIDAKVYEEDKES